MSSDKDEKYYSLPDAYRELVNESYTKSEKATSVAKLFGKGLFNAAKFTVKEIIPGVTKTALQQVKNKGEESLKRDDLTSEQRSRIQEKVDYAKENLNSFKDKDREQK